MSARYERKYNLSPKELLEAEQRLSAALHRDEHCEYGPYHIRSIYLDGPKWPALWEKVSGTSPRRKYRIRFYNKLFHQPQLECKMKSGEQITKLSRPLSTKELKDILHQRRTKLSNEPLMRQFQIDQRTNGLRPHITVDYLRLAFVHPLGKLRITLDTDLSTGPWRDWNSLSNMPVRVIDHSGILELKYTALHPKFIQMILPSLPSPQLAISKYVLCHSQLAHPLRGL